MSDSGTIGSNLFLRRGEWPAEGHQPQDAAPGFLKAEEAELLPSLVVLSG
jgi:hypothetical protein